MHKRSVPTRPPPRRRRFGAALEENSHQLRMVLMSCLVQSRLCDPGVPLDHLECSSDIATMADPHHFIFELALRCRWCLSLRAYRTGLPACGHPEKNGDLIELTIARAGERRIVPNLVPKFSGPAFCQWICASVEQQSHHLDPTAAHRVVQRLEIRILGSGKRRIARQHLAHGYFVTSIHGGEKWPGIATPQGLVKIRGAL